MKTTLVHSFTDGAGTVDLYQNGPDSFMVVYGAHVRSDMPYTVTAREYGQCVFHSLQCAGKFTE